MLYRSMGVVLLTAAFFACGNDSPGPTITCTASQTNSISLVEGGYTSIDQPCISFSANPSTTDTGEYLVVAHSAGGSPGVTASYQLTSTHANSSAAATQMVAQRISTARPGGFIAAQFDQLMRERARASVTAVPGGVSASTMSPAAAPYDSQYVGKVRIFPKVCANLGCTTYRSVTAHVLAVSGHVAIYVDDNMPGDINTAGDSGIDSLALTFDQHVYAVDKVSFGDEPDIDNNHVIIALLTGQVNALITDRSSCFTTGYVAGYFNSQDLDLQVASLYNNGEIMYGLVPDASGQYSCPHSRASVLRILPPTFLHEFQHMINYTAHVRVRRGNAEDIWLDEALANFAEELGGRSFLPGGVLGVNPSADSIFYRYALDDLNDAYMYLEDPQDHFLLSPTDANLPDNGGAWMFVRYLVDQTYDSITHKLVNTSLTGTSNITSATGQPCTNWIAGWSLANWISDLPGFSAPPQLSYKSWQFRQAFPLLRTLNPGGSYPYDFPLVPLVSMGSQVNVVGILHVGSGLYIRVKQPPSGGSFTLALTGPFDAPLPPGMTPRLEVIKIH